jgi:hypothetical protein
MPTTERITHAPDRETDDNVATDMPARDEETQAKLDKTEALLDEIDSVLDTETIEHVMTLGDLIRRGAMLRPQVYGTWRNCEGTCALGAAEDEAKRLGLL